MCKEWRLFFITLVYELLLLLVPIFYNQTVLTVYDYQYLFIINQYQQYVIITYCFKINVYILILKIQCCFLCHISVLIDLKY